MFKVMSLARNLYNRFKERLYYCYCPVCERRVKEFLPLPNFYREKTQLYGHPYSLDDYETLNYKQYSCPHCKSSDRERLSALYIREIYHGRKSKLALNLIEFAPSAPLGRMIMKLGAFNLRTADLSMECVDDKINLEDMSIYEAASFDCFICSHVLEHVPDDWKALRELQRILKPDGWGILMVPLLLLQDEIDEDSHLINEEEQWRRFGQNNHVRTYSKKGFLHRVEEVGFTVNQFGWQHFGADLFGKAGITKKSVLYVVEKASHSSSLCMELA
jgi:hypothetical protein